MTNEASSAPLLLIPARDLQPGQMLDLEGDAVVDPDRSASEFEFEYVTVDTVIIGAVGIGPWAASANANEVTVLSTDDEIYVFPASHLVAVAV